MNAGAVVWDVKKSAWFGGMAVGAVVGGPLTWSPGAMALAALTTAVTLCVGHSVGIHRRLIHRSFVAPRWVERLLAYVGVLVGLGGPIGLLQLHDTRDREQNQADCHDYFAHRRAPWLDYLWNLHCRFDFHAPPALPDRRDVTADPFYRWLEATWRWQQLPWTLLLFLWGGVPFVVWGVCVRITVSTFGHWFVGYVCHRDGGRRWENRGAAVQGFNAAWLGAVSMGEGWHNNHHAFPRSARLGLAPHEWDLGWLFIRALRRLGIAREVLTADHPAARAQSTTDLSVENRRAVRRIATA